MSSHRDRPWVYKALIAAVVAAVLGGSVSPADAGTTASISGRVVDASTGLGVAGVTVDVLINNNSGLWGSLGGAPIVTAADGTYTDSNLPYGTYRVSVEASQDHVSRWYGGGTSLSTATDIAVHEDQATTGINIAVPAAAHITGEVTGADTSAGVGQVYVVAYKSTDLSYPARSAWSDANGTYDVGGLDAGTYIVCARTSPPSPYLWQCWQAAADTSSARPITVPAGATIANTDFVLVRGATLTGTVTIAGNGPATSGYVEVYQRDSQGVLWQRGRSAIGSNGSYQVLGLPAASLFVSFSGPGFATEYWENATDLAHATPVPVTAGSTTTLNATVEPPPPPQLGTVTGRVVDWQGAPIAGATVNVGQHSTTTLSDGTYSLTIPVGTYGAYFTAPGYLEANYQPADPSASSYVTVTLGQTTGNIDATLYPPARASGTATDPDGHPLTNFAVWAMRRNSNGHWDTVGSAGGSSTGTWQITGLLGGTYTFVFLAGPGQGLATTYLGGTHSIATAQTVDVPTGGSTGDIAGVLDRAGSISGTLTWTGMSLAAHPISVVKTAPQDWLNDLVPTVTTHENGTYTVNDLVPGTYTLTYFCDAPQVFGLAPGATPTPSTVPVAATRTITVTSGGSVREDVDETGCQLATTAKATTVGVPRVGRTLTARVGTYRPYAVRISITWFRGTRATTFHGSTYRLTKLDRGQRISAHVRVTRTGYRPLTYATSPTHPIAAG
ncbi:carboxypeptidase-like regulatory domain-containing protein [Nocardioides baekrokdamisoli]|nr:carboxypeptidase-like regulatory domain-containing protein [Nocardioides baekrokdamisoli]